VIATNLADSSKSATAFVTVTPAAPALSVSPDSLSFAGQVGSPNLSPSSLSITNSGSGTLTFTGMSDQPWLRLSAGSGTAPSSVQVSSQSSGLKAGTYTGHVTVTGAGATRTVGVSLTLTSPPVQHSVALSWKASTNAKVVSYSMYRRPARVDRMPWWPAPWARLRIVIKACNRPPPITTSSPRWTIRDKRASIRMRAGPLSPSGVSH
jgi:Viral BACON domain